MPKQIINVGAPPGNSGDGDILRDAFIKTQQNFDELYAFGPITDVSLDHSDPSIPGTIAQALAECTANGGGAVLVGPGIFNLDTNEVVVGSQCRLIGAGKGATTLNVTHNNNVLRTGGDGLGAFSEWLISDLTINLPATNSSSAIASTAAQSSVGAIKEIKITGGAPASWGVTMDAVNIVEITGFTYFGDGNGIRWINSQPFNLNIGDSLIQNCDIYLNNDSTIGIQLASPEFNATRRVNNVLLSRVEIVGRNGIVRNGTIAVHLRNTARITLLNVDIENTDTGILQESAVSGGAIATSNAFIQVYALGCNNDYVEVGDRPVRQLILGGHGQFLDEQRLPSSDILAYDNVMGENRVFTAVRPIESYTDTGAPRILTVVDSGTVFTNKGASGTVTFLLPPASLGHSVEYEFHLVEFGQRIRVQPGVADLIRPGQIVTGETYESDTGWGQILKLRNVDGTIWSVLSESGSWTSI